MTKTKTTRRSKTTTTRSTKTAKRAEAPLGLMLLFSMVRDPYTTQLVSQSDARRAFPIAKRLIKRLHSLPEREVSGLVQEYIDPMFGFKLDEGEKGQPELVVADAAFRIGLATAWTLMQGLNSQEAVR